METKNLILLLYLMGAVLTSSAQNKLTGTIIKNAESASRPAAYAFDGNTSTSYSSTLQTHAWVGLDLGSKHVINKVRWYNYVGSKASATVSLELGWDGNNKQFEMPYCCTAVFEGANQSDFSDAMPLYLITDASTDQKWREADVNVSRGFRYVRYMGAVESGCRIAELEFYGTEGEGDDSQFYQPTNLPVVVVHTKRTEKVKSDGQTVIYEAGTDPWPSHDAYPNDEERDATFTFISQDGAKVMTCEGSFRERGNSSRHFAKRPYRIKLNEKEKVFAAPAKSKKWTLVPAIDDLTLMRNLIGYGINEKLGAEYTPYIRPVDVFVNGEFKGQYQFCDQVEASKNKIDIEEIKPTAKDADGNPISWPGDAMSDFGWFFEIDAQMQVYDVTRHEAPGSWFVTESPEIPVSIKSPDSDENVAAYTDVIEEHLMKLFQAAANGTVADYLDLPSFARYFLGIEFVANTDGYRSIFMHKHAGNDKIFAGPLWDLNLTLNNDYRIGDINQAKDWSYKERLKRGDEHWANAGDIASVIGNIIEKNPIVMKEIKDVWANVRQSGAISNAVLDAEVDSFTTKLNQSQAINYMRWPILDHRFFYHPNYNGSDTWYQSTSPGTWAGEIAVMQDALDGRVAWMDQKVGLQTAQKSISIPSYGWTTVYLPMAFKVPQDLTCYQITDVEDNQLLLQEVESTEANQPYLLKGEPGNYTLTGYAGGYLMSNKAGSYTLSSTTGNYVSDPSRGERTLGLLNGVAQDRTAAEGTYVLQEHDGRSCFFRVDGSSGAQFTTDCAYLVLPAEVASVAPLCFYLDEEELMMGDVNADKQINKLDLECLADYLNGKKPAKFIDKAADLNQSGTISIADLTKLIQILSTASPSK